MGDLIETLKGVGATVNHGLTALKNYAAPEAPGGRPVPPQPGPGGIRYNRDGTAPAPPALQTVPPIPRAKGGCVMKGGSPVFKNVDNSGLKKEPC